MTKRIFNFSAGPAVLPEPVLEEARDNLLSLGDAGAGICEVSHRSAEYTEIHHDAMARIKRLLGAEHGYEQLFLQGGASTQFFQVPMNLGGDADYVLTGTWAKKAYAEAKRFGKPRVAASSEPTNFDRIPGELDLNPGARYLHLTSNNTVAGTQWHAWPQAEAPLVIDMSSDILSRPVDLRNVGLIYAGAQKNLGPAGVTLVLIREDLLAKCSTDLPTMLRYDIHAKEGSRYNTPPTFAIYVVGLVAKWIEAQGGLEAMAEKNQRKASLLYACIDRHELYRGATTADSRSLMNVTFRLTSEELEQELINEAEAKGLSGLAGHRSVGGLRASIYNAMPEAGVKALVDLMDDFARRKG
ncbi:MAG: 3-phosphoserine/phosphohydroxythreonine transaminase [Planctomycetota bacterium]